MVKLFALSLLTGMVLFSQEDHPLVSRYAGSTYFKSKVQAYSDYLIATAPGTLENVRLKNPRKLEGKVSHFYYFSPEGRAPLEILRNYQGALTKAGFKPVLECANEGGCGSNFFAVIWGDKGGNGSWLFESNSLSSTMTNRYGMDTRYYVAQLEQPTGLATVVLQIGNIDKSWDSFFKITPGRSLISLSVIESSKMDTGMVTVDAKAMSNSIKDTGKVVLYNIYFDTNSATLKPESDPALEEIKKLLALNPSQKLLVVGHTDNQGTVEFNADLSKRRATAVVDALVKRFAIPATRLAAHGVGRLSPVAANTSEEGRAKNRRVELVEW